MEFQINKILFTDEGPATSKNNYANDIAILILEEPIAFGDTVSPACLDWTGKKFQPQEKTQGTVNMPIKLASNLHVIRNRPIMFIHS